MLLATCINRVAAHTSQIHGHWMRFWYLIPFHCLRSCGRGGCGGCVDCWRNAVGRPGPHLWHGTSSASIVAQMSQQKLEMQNFLKKFAYRYRCGYRVAKASSGDVFWLLI